MGFKQFIYTSGNIKKLQYLIENYSKVPSLGIKIYYPLPLTSVRG
jgi:hypothetical protein